MLLFDAQTSGGLLLSVPPEKLEPLFGRAAQLGQVLWEVGEVAVGEDIEVV
jgi:selenophosphate synthase